MAKPLGAAWAVAAQRFISGRAPAEQPTLTAEQERAGAHEDAFLAEKTKNNREASSSRGTRRSGRAPFPPTSAALLRQLPPGPQPEDYVGRGATIDDSPPRERDRRYVRLEECEAL
jgi:hypothetical protein